MRGNGKHGMPHFSTTGHPPIRETKSTSSSGVYGLVCHAVVRLVIEEDQKNSSCVKEHCVHCSACYQDKSSN